MRVLIACEFSGVVRDAFIALGHDAVSCDLLPTESPGPHIMGDVRPVLKESWDLVIAHPPCTRLCNSGVRWLHDHPATETFEDAVADMQKDAESVQKEPSATATRSRRGGL